MKSVLRLVSLLVVTAVGASAQTATIPTAAEMTTSITAIGGVAAAAAALGFSIWLYRKVRAKAGQAVG